MQWREDASELLLGLIWDAYELLRIEVLNEINWAGTGEDLERQITQLLELRIRKLMSGYEPFQSQHGPYEAETRKAPPAQPPQYDIAFVWNDNPRLMWPVEAKVLESDQAVSEYVKELRDNFLTCRYAPFSGEAGMLGYLRFGNGVVALREIGARVPCEMRRHSSFPLRAHGISEHLRSVPPGKEYSESFRCHHLMMPLDGNDDSEEPGG